MIPMSGAVSTIPSYQFNQTLRYQFNLVQEAQNIHNAKLHCLELNQINTSQLQSKLIRILMGVETTRITSTHEYAYAAMPRTTRSTRTGVSFVICV